MNIETLKRSESTNDLINPSLTKMPVSLKKSKKNKGTRKKKKPTQTPENNAVYEFGALSTDFNDMYFKTPIPDKDTQAPPPESEPEET